VRIGKPLLLTTTTLGIGIGLYEGYHFAGGLVVLMLAMMSVVGAGIGTIVMIARRERREEQARARQDDASAEEPK
jgi:hypothetical protein